MKSKKKATDNNKNKNKHTYKRSFSRQLKENILIYWNHKLSRSWAACNFIKNMDIKCNTAPVTGRGIESYKKHLFMDKKDVFLYLKNKNFLDVGCGINHVYKNALLYKLIKKNYKAMGLDLYNFPTKHKNFVSRSIKNTKLKSNSYDVITSQYFLYYWMDNPKDLLETYRELLRILKKNGEIRIYPVYFGNFHYNNSKLLNYLLKHFTIKVLKPRFVKEKVAYIYPGEDTKNIKLTDNSVPEKEADDAFTLNASLVILKKK